MTNFESTRDVPGNAAKSWLGITAFWTVRKEVDSTDVRRGIFETVEGLLSAKLNILLKRVTNTQVSLLSILSKVTQFSNSSFGI